MNKKLNRTDRFEALHHNRDSLLSLKPLNAMLAHAQRDLPHHVASLPEDPGEELASQLVARVRHQFRRSCPAHWVGSALRYRSKEMAGPDVR